LALHGSGCLREWDQPWCRAGPCRAELRGPRSHKLHVRGPRPARRAPTPAVTWAVGPGRMAG
jgi:hypothetical protein